MIDRKHAIGAILGFSTLLGATSSMAQDWPQWRGAGRDGKVEGFVAPKEWPKELTKKWAAKVGSGDSTPALVGDKLYVFSRDGAEEVTQCLSTANGNEIWKDKYATKSVTGPAGSHPGPRSSPAVAEGKVITLGVAGVLSCLDAASGKVVWRKEDVKATPQFYTATSPIIVDGMCIVQLGGRGNGVMVALDLNSGNEKWKWTGEGPACASPVLMTAEGTKQVVTMTERGLVGIGASDGKLLWQYTAQAGGGGAAPGGGGGRPGGPGGGGPGGGGGRRGGGMGGGMSYNAVTPVVDGQTVIVLGLGRGSHALKIAKKGDAFEAKEVWSNPDVGAQFCTPVLKEGLLYGLSDRGTLFCLKAATGEIAWTDTGKRSNYGAMIDAGPVVLTLPSNAELTAFKPSDKSYSEVAKIKVSSGETYAYPVIAGNRVIIKDKEAVTMYTLE